MKTVTKVWLITASALTALGLILFAAAMTVSQWDFTALDSEKYVTKTYEITEEFQHLSLQTSTAKISFLPAEDGNACVVCHEPEKGPHTVLVRDGALEITEQDTRKWYEQIQLFSFQSPSVTVYLPQGEYGRLKIDGSTGDLTVPKEFTFQSVQIHVSTGDVTWEASVAEALQIELSTGSIRMKDLSAGSVNITVSTGKVTAESIRCSGEVQLKVSTGDATLTDLTCTEFRSTGSTGDLSLKNLLAEDRITIHRSTGDVTFDRCDAGSIAVETETGDVTGTLRSDKTFLPQSDTGRIDVPKTTRGEICEITTDTGDIRIQIEG